MQFNHKWGPPLSFTNMLSLKDYPHHLTKNESRTSKIPISQFFCEWENLEMQPRLLLKKKKANNFPSFSCIDKNLEGQIKKHVKSKISLWIWKKLEVQPNTKSQKITILNLWMNWEKLLSNLSFTIEIKIGTLRKTFQT